MTKKEKYQISCVNNGKPFEIEKWTVKKHKAVLKEMTKYEKDNPDLTEKDKDENISRYFNFTWIKNC